MRRTTKILFFLFLILFFGGFFGFAIYAVASTNNIIINEIMYNPDGSSDTGKEWIEFFNKSTTIQDLSGLTLQIRGTIILNYTFSDAVINSNDFMLIHLRKNEINDSHNIYIPATENISNTGGSISIYNGSTITDFVQYGKANQTFSSDANNAGIWNKAVFLPLADEGKSLELKKDGMDNNFPDDWQGSFIIGGTPGKENSKKLEDAAIIPPCKDFIILSEIYPFTDEFVEVKNIGTEKCDLAGWKIGDEKNGSHAFSADSFIDPGKYFAFVHDFNLNSTSADSAKLFNPTNSEPIEIRSYENPESDKSYSRDESGEWKWTSKLTPGLKNVFDEDSPPIVPSKDSDYIGKIKINEIYPSPDTNAGEKEFLEIKNISKEKINLRNWSASDAIHAGKSTLKEDLFLDPDGLYVFEGSFYLNTPSDTAKIFDENGNEVASILYDNAKSEYSYSFDDTAWQWTSKETRGVENQFDELLSGQIKKDQTIYVDIYADFEVKADDKVEHFTWNFGDGHKSYLKETRHKYEDSGTYLATLKLTGEGKDNILNFEVEVKKYPTPKIKIVKIKANPKGKDTLGEEIYLKNNSKKKINLKTWSLATGSKTLYNHPITKDFIIKPGKTKKITRKYSLFTLNNKKGAIELRYPNGEVASRVKYDKKKESVKDDEVYELAGKNWQWSTPPEEILTEVSLPEENPEDVNLEIESNISNEEIALSLGKYSSENKLALVEMGSLPTSKNLLQSRETLGIVLGTFSARSEIRQPVELKTITSWQKTWQKSNQLFNFLINQLLGLI